VHRGDRNAAHGSFDLEAHSTAAAPAAFTAFLAGFISPSLLTKTPILYEAALSPVGALIDTRSPRILKRMSVKLLRRILALFIVTAYFGATLQAVPSYTSSADMSQAAMGGMMQHPDNPSDKTPCKGMLRGCVSDIGCIFLVSLAAPNAALFTLTAWSSVIYPASDQWLRGRTIKPALGPPISLA
jgi:hypothetical protein